MHRIYLEQILKPGEYTFIKGDSAHYLIRVLRLKCGEKILIFNGDGAEYLAKIEEVFKDEVRIMIETKKYPQIESPLDITLFQGIPKSAKMDLIVRGTTELGIKTIIPFFSSRTVPRYENHVLKRKVSHWKKIAAEASRQSGRTRVPEIRIPFKFDEMVRELANAKNALKIALWEREEENGIKEILKYKDRLTSIYFIIGPEGGFSEKEILALKEAGCASISLGRRVLRTETAALTMLVIIQYEWGDLS